MVFKNKLFIKYWITVIIFITITLYYNTHFKSFKYIKRKEVNYKYILQWTLDDTTPFKFMGKGTQGFIDRKCPYTNCYVTSNRTFFGINYTKFDVVVFSGPDLAQYPIELPQTRSQHQKYVFASIESPENYPICSSKYNNYFNWTWTYKLDSDLRWGYIIVRDVNNKIVGPNINMEWLRDEEMAPVTDKLKKELRSKSKIAAWFASNCDTMSYREEYVKSLQKELLKLDENYKIDIFGKCGNLNCSRYDNRKCKQIIKDTYYFYLAFENSIAEDYVTEKILYGLQNNAIPIVYGGANYSRFMPDGIYLNAGMGDEKLAKKMHELKTDFEKYVNYFKWQNHYSFARTMDDVKTNEYCLMCKMLNDEKLLKTTSETKDFLTWWNGRPIDEDNCYDSY